MIITKVKLEKKIDDFVERKCVNAFEKKNEKKKQFNKRYKKNSLVSEAF